MNIQQYLSDKAELVERQLEKIIPAGELPPSLEEATRYVVLGGGKRIRPILAIAVAEALGKCVGETLIPACALELIHTYSLIHDDLPCMDNDDFRRGKPTLHKVYNEAHAVLTGDYLVALAFELLACAPGLDAEQRVKLVEILAKRSGGQGMVSGQVLDIEGEELALTLERLQEIHHKKTGALISASVEFGAICGKANEEQLKALRLYARELGIAFQITDDILDVTTGKDSDSKNGKTTYVTLFGLKGSQDRAKSHVQAATEALLPFGTKATPLVEIANLLLHRKK